MTGHDLLFVAGLGRSGTTALMEVLVAHDDIAMGVERYKRLYPRDGEPVTDLEPYLGAYGHLVALRAGDLAYLHVHPEGGRGPVAFRAEVPSEGAYHLFLDFKHDGVVRTAAFAVGTGE